MGACGSGVGGTIGLTGLGEEKEGGGAQELFSVPEGTVHQPHPVCFHKCHNHSHPYHGISLPLSPKTHTRTHTCTPASSPVPGNPTHGPSLFQLVCFLSREAWTKASWCTFLWVSAKAAFGLWGGCLESFFAKKHIQEVDFPESGKGTPKEVGFGDRQS